MVLGGAALRRCSPLATLDPSAVSSAGEPSGFVAMNLVAVVSLYVYIGPAALPLILLAQLLRSWQRLLLGELHAKSRAATVAFESRVYTQPGGAYGYRNPSHRKNFFALPRSWRALTDSASSESWFGDLRRPLNWRCWSASSARASKKRRRWKSIPDISRGGSGIPSPTGDFDLEAGRHGHCLLQLERRLAAPHRRSPSISPSRRLFHREARRNSSSRSTQNP